MTTDDRPEATGEDRPAFSRSRIFERKSKKHLDSLREREVRAVERAARWALCSVLLSLVALAVSVWPVVSVWFSGMR
jgi:hypothetical protein